jgi:hypothetical protein
MAIHLPTAFSGEMPDSGADADRLLQIQLKKNLLAVQAHRPALLAKLTQVPATGRYRVTQIGQALSIADYADPAKPKILSADRNPIAAVQTQMKRLSAVMKVGQSIALRGIGDGYLLSALAHCPPALFMDMQQCIWLFEPDAELLRIAMMLHDYTGPAGPIEQPRFKILVGDDWGNQYLQTTIENPCLPLPQATVDQSEHRKRIDQTLSEAQAAIRSADHEVARRVESYYAEKKLQWTIDTLRRDLPRPPRLMLVTSRFTSVLQYATRDTAAAFEQLGWQTFISIEQSPEERAFVRSIHAHLDAFKPDVVFLIDYLRKDAEGAYPANLPVISWLQDHMQHLLEPGVGAKIDPLNFVLTFAAPMFIHKHGYPPGQCIDVPMMMAKDRGIDFAVHEENESPRFDLTYVSNVSGTSERLKAVTLDNTQDASKAFIEDLADKLIAHDAVGHSLPTYLDLHEFICNQSNMHLLPAGSQLESEAIVKLLWNPLNIGLYRQQSLRWVAEIARSTDLKLGIFGNGWEAHPDFAEFAQGPVQPGEPLEQLTRDTRINLNLEPYACFSHHRLLDGIMSGGFFLVRRHPTQRLLIELRDFLVEHLPGSPATSQEALAGVDDQNRQALQTLLDQAKRIAWTLDGDPVEQLRCWERADLVPAGSEALPGLEAVSFDTPEHCQALIRQYLDDTHSRTKTVASMADSIAGRLTFESQMQRVIQQISDRLSSRP